MANSIPLIGTLIISGVGVRIAVKLAVSEFKRISPSSDIIVHLKWRSDRTAAPRERLVTARKLISDVGRLECDVRKRMRPLENKKVQIEEHKVATIVTQNVSPRGAPLPHSAIFCCRGVWEQWIRTKNVRAKARRRSCPVIIIPVQTEIRDILGDSLTEESDTAVLSSFESARAAMRGTEAGFSIPSLI